MTGDEEILKRFILRARRVQAHSMVQDWDDLVQHARGAIDGRLDLAGRMTLTRRLPRDEEVFESLASRVRPLTVKAEPVYHVKVFDAIQRLLDDSRVDDAVLTRMQELRQAWKAAEIQGTQVQAYSLQAASDDSAAATNKVSDTQLAAAWLYADLVHADAQGPKQDALAFSLRERYAAAVRVFSHMAALTVETMRLIERLRDAHAIVVDTSAWEDDVIVGTSQIVQEAKVYVAPVGSEMPDMRDSLELTQEWKAFTVTELRRQDPANRIRVVLRDGNDEIKAAYEAAVTACRKAAASVEWDVLVADSVLFKFTLDFQGDRLTDVRSREWEVVEATNELILASTRLLLELDRASNVTFEIEGSALFSLGISALSDEERRRLEVLAETVEDLVKIESLRGQALSPCNGHFCDRDRVRVRRARLLWEGHIVHAMRHPVEVTARMGEPPLVLVTKEGTLNVGGAEVPIPRTFLRHPAMTVIETGFSPEVGPQAKTFQAIPPEGEQFFAWAPDLVEVSEDESLMITVQWDLSGIDEDRFTF